MADEQHNANLLTILNTLGDATNDQHHNAQMFAELKNAVSECKPSGGGGGGHQKKPPPLRGGAGGGGHANKHPTLRGDANEDIEEFIQQFTRHADFYNSEPSH